MPILSLILPALLPAVVDGLKGLFTRMTGGAGARPASVDEAIKLMAAETAKLKAIAELDKPSGEISKWVADLRASFRYLAAAIIILTSMSVTVLAPENPLAPYLLEMSGSVFAFLFGDRVYLHLKQK